MSKITKKILVISTLVFAVFVLFAFTVSAIEYPLPGINKDNPTIGQYIRALFIWGLGIVGALAVATIAFGGFLYMIGRVSEGKDYITSALIGLLLLFGTWLILYTINPNLATLKEPTLQAPTSSTTTTCSSNLSTSPNLSTPTPQQQQNDFAEAGVDQQSSNLLETKALDQNVEPLTSNGVVSQSTTNYVNNATNLNGVDNARVAAIIQAESSGNTNAVHTDVDGKSSYGLMQIRVGTARDLDPQGTSGLSDQEVANKLTSDPNYNMNLGTQYYSDLVNRYNGDTTLAHAAYNGGPVANNPSVDCPGSARWQCQWDNTAQTVPNTGYAPTRTYVNNINTYVNSFQK